MEETIGRRAIEMEVVANFAGPWKGARIRINVGSIQHLSADVAVNEGTYEVTGIRTPDGKAAPSVKGSDLKPSASESQEGNNPWCGSVRIDP